MMLHQRYGWKRFWCPRDGSMNLSDEGYLVDPDSEFGHVYNPDVVPFKAIARIPCLVLLGDPGIGKSTCMVTYRNVPDAHVGAPGGAVSLWCDLATCQSDYTLYRNVFDSQTFKAWLEGEHELLLFLDSLDECVLRFSALVHILADEFSRCPAARLRLRIACRTAVWPGTLEEALRRYWGKDGVGVYELAPLRRVDVVEASRANGLDPDAFLREIHRVEAVPLAIRPITLRLLLNQFARTGQLTSTQSDLFLEGCRLLCEETEQRRDVGLRGNLSAGQRMAVAARIAAVTLLSGRSAIWTGVDQGDVPEGDLRISDLSGGRETSDGIDFNVSEGAIMETLDTGLFSARGPRRLGFSHQTYAEFLAAWHLVQHEVPMTQIMSMIVHPDDPDGRLIPQLHGVAAWLAGMRPDVLREVRRKDPEVLLRSDVATLETEDRQALVAALLRLYDEEALMFDWDYFKYFKKLAHQNLACQLRPYVCDATRNETARSVAVMIAGQCGLQELQHDLLSIALEPSEPLALRVHAAHAVSHIGDSRARAALKPLAAGAAGDDPDDELKGYALEAIWPDHITARELFTLITPPKRKNFLGAYSMFLSDGLVRHLRPVDLPCALKWAEEQVPRHSLAYDLEGLLDGILALAWSHLEAPQVLESFARASLSRLRHHEGVFGDDERFRELRQKWTQKRRLILRTALPMLSEFGLDPSDLVYAQTPLATGEDLQWMIEWLKQEDCGETKRVLVRLIERVFDSRDSDHLKVVYQASRDNSDVAEAFRWLLAPVELVSPEAERMKERYRQSLEWERDSDRPHRIEPPPGERIAILLDECESGNPAAWWRLNMEMTLEPDSTHYGDELESDLTVLPGWRDSDDATRNRIVRAARRYLLECDPETKKWLGTDSFHRPAAAGYRALRLLYQEAPPLFHDIPTDVWRKWAPIILAYPSSSGTPGEEPHQALVGIAYSNAPDEVLDTLMLLIDEESRSIQCDHLFIIRKVKNCWDERLARALLGKVVDPSLRPGCMGDLLSELLMHECTEAREYAASLLPLRMSSAGDDRIRAVAAASALMTHTEDAGWDTVWPIIQEDCKFGCEVLAYTNDHSSRDLEYILPRLSEHQLADLFIWLERQYPRSEDPHYEDVHYVGFRESVADFRDSILRRLEACGTPDACDAVRRILDDLPNLTWLKRVLLATQANARRKTWVRPEPSTVLALVANANLRFVQSERQLLDVVVESLRRLEAKLQGETPAAIDLWDEISKGVYRPKDEGRFSDYVKRHLDGELKGKGIISNREVQIRRGVGSVQGESTDIHVDCARRDSHGEVLDTVSVVFEVKGCWNREVKTAMKTQLADRYLRDSRCRHGIYLVGWFLCDQWDSEHYQRADAVRNGSDYAEMQATLDAQATELSKGGLCIRAVVLNACLR